MNIWNNYITSVRTKIQVKQDKKLLTERQWKLKHFVKINDKCGKYLWINAYCPSKELYLWYGNFLDRDKREFSAVGKNQKGNKTIVFRPFQDQLYAASVGHHRSPEGVFQVRGHFRRYKTGKVIWIDGFMKGVDKIDN